MNQFAAIAATALLAAIWQGALLAAVVATTLRLLPAISAATRSLLWTATFALLIVLHFLPALHTANFAPAHPLQVAPVWSLALAVLWLALSLYRAAQFLLSAQRLRQISRSAIPINPKQLSTPFGRSERLLDFAPHHESCRAATSNPRRYTLCVSPDVDRPSVLGFFHPRILLPLGLLETLTSAEIQQILLHETEHLRRSDDWTNLLQKLALVLFPLNPVLAWVERRMCLERELACDQRVLATGENIRKSYATTLTRLAEHSLLHRGLHLALGLLGKRPAELSTRVHRILARPARSLTQPQSRLATAVVLAGVVGLTTTLAYAPSLVTFNASPSAEQAESQVASPLVPETWKPRPVLARAVLPDSRIQSSARTLEAVAHTPAPRAIRKKLRLASAPRVINTSYRALAAEAGEQDATRPQLVLASAHRTRVHAQVQQFVIPTVYYVPTAYAALRTPDGWIIFQL
jgi:beta-lactamase regulating signal transducer with metallopeptidase domain